MQIFLFKANGNYFGFISDGNIFSRDGEYLGWVENNIAWDKNGTFRGQLIKINENHYLLRNKLAISPIPRIPKVSPVAPVPPIPQINIIPVTLPIGFVDSF